jgi:serine/threonine-protein kinase
MPGTGDTIGRYVIEALLGEGGMGRVYRALDPSLGRRVALKVLITDGVGEGARADAAARMAREARAAAAFAHPNVVTIHDVGVYDNAPFIAMELVTGDTLRARGNAPGVTHARKAKWLLDVARGLTAAHRAGLVHRDIKPENIMITDDGIVKVLDFGIARRSAEADDGTGPTQPADLASLTMAGMAIGTPYYMAPEQLEVSPLDGRCDQYAWGVTAYELFSGALPWQGKRGAHLVAAILAGGVAPLDTIVPTIDPRISAVVARAMQRDRNQRFASMNDVVIALGLEEAPVQTPSPVVVHAGGTGDVVANTTAAPVASAPTPAPAAPRRRAACWLGGAATLVGLGLVLARTLGAAPAPPGEIEAIDVPILGPLPTEVADPVENPWAPPPHGELRLWSAAREHGRRQTNLERYCRPFS